MNLPCYYLLVLEYTAQCRKWLRQNERLPRPACLGACRGSDNGWASSGPADKCSCLCQNSLGPYLTSKLANCCPRIHLFFIVYHVIALLSCVTMIMALSAFSVTSFTPNSSLYSSLLTSVQLLMALHWPLEAHWPTDTSSNMQAVLHFLSSLATSKPTNKVTLGLHFMRGPVYLW